MEIHNYALESLIFQDEDYYDIDFWDGAAFVTKKILGSTIKAGILASVVSENIYNTDGTLTTDRIVSMNNNTLVFENAAGGVGIRLLGTNEAQVQFARGNEFVAWSIGKDVDGSETFQIRRFNGTGGFVDVPFQIDITTGAILFNGAYSFPTTAGLTDQVLMLNVSNELEWVGLADVNIYNSNGSLAGARFVDLAGNILSFSDINGDTKFEGNLLTILANAGSEAILNLMAGNNQKRALQWTDQGDLRWELTTEVPEIGGDTGTDLVLYSYDDAGLLIGEVLRIERSTGIIKLNNAYKLPNVDGTNGQVLTTDGSGTITWQSVGGSSGTGNVITASTQWSKILPAPITLANGLVANGFTFFDNVVDKVADGTTPYYEFHIDYGITITLSGTSGSANINVNGVNYLATYTISLFQTAVNWVSANQSALNALGIVVFALGSGANGRIRFGSSNETLLNNITITNVVANLNGVLANEFTGLPNAKGDHIRVQYNGEPIDGQRLLHTIRANFNIVIGSVQYAELRLYRYQNDSVIGSGVTVQRNPDESGQQVVLETYTGGPLDAFVSGGFYIGLANNTGTTLDFIGSSGILIQTIFQKPTLF